MRVLCDVFDADGDPLGEGPVSLFSGTTTRLIDGSGGVKLDAPASVRSRELLTPGRQIKLYYEIENDLTLMGEGIIKKAGLSGDKLAVDCNDLMEELKYDNTLRNWNIDGDTVQQALSDLISDLGWTIEASGSAATSTVVLPLNGETKLKAVLSVAESAGVHVRLAYRGNRILQVGDFGTDIGIILFDANSGAGGDEWSGVLESLTIEEQGDQLVNRLLPEGGAFESNPNVTLEDSVHTGISTIAGRDAALNYYREDAASVALYGVRWGYKTYPDIKPLSASGADRIAAANQLDDATVFDLAKLSTIRQNFKGKIRGLTTLLLPGDLVRVIYAGTIYQDDGSIWTGSAIDSYLYINRVEIYAGEGGTWQTVDLSNVNAQRVDEATDTAIAIERSKKA